VTAKTLFRVGIKVRTIDEGARVHGRPPDKPESIGTIQDHHRPFGRQSPDRSPPYYVVFDSGDSAWYDASEVERVTSRGAQQRRTIPSPPVAKRDLDGEIDGLLAKKGPRREVDVLVLTRDAESPELWSNADLESQVSRYLRRWPGRHNSVRLFGAMMSELVERRRSGGELGTDAEIDARLRAELT
jgi:hypothetical protein